MGVIFTFTLEWAKFDDGADEGIGGYVMHAGTGRLARVRPGTERTGSAAQKVQ